MRAFHSVADRPVDYNRSSHALSEYDIQYIDCVVKVAVPLLRKQRQGKDTPIRVSLLQGGSRDSNVGLAVR